MGLFTDYRTLITDYIFTSQYCIIGMEVEAVLPRDEGEGLGDVRHEFLGGACLAGVVARGLDAAGECAATVEAPYVVPLSAVHGDGDGGEGAERGVGGDAEAGVALFCEGIGIHKKWLVVSG